MLTDDIIIVKNTTAIGVAKMRQRAVPAVARRERDEEDYFFKEGYNDT